MQFTEAAISRIVRRGRDEYRDHMNRLRIRRLLLEMAADSYQDGNGTGTNIPPPFDKSKLVIKALIGDLAEAAQDFTSIIASNEPRVKVVPVVVDRTEATQRMDREAGEEERLRQTMWENADGQAKHRQVTYSQVWGRVGWYFTLRRDDAWGMPTRHYFDLPVEEAEALKASGRAVDVYDQDGNVTYSEPGEAYLERRKAQARRNAVSARSLFTLQAFPPDVVVPTYDNDGVKWAYASLEIPAFDCGPGSDYARMDAQRHAPKDADIGKWGLYFDKDEKTIVGGVTQGGEPDVHSGDTWTLTVFGTRDECYFLVSATPESTGRLIWYTEHDMGDCPFVPVPAFRTDSNRPGGEASSPMEKLFAEGPILIQLFTLASLDAAYDGIPRWVIVDESGQLVRDAATGDPKVIASETAPGLDPKQAAVVGGTPIQLKIDSQMLFKWAEFMATRFDEGKPSPAATGGEGVAGSTAWGMRQMIEQQMGNLSEPVQNHAAAVTKIQRMWGHALRAAAERGEIETVYAFAMPETGRRRERTPRGLIEFDPAHLTDAIQVKQSSDTAQAKIVKGQYWIERLNSGTATLRQVLEEGFDEEDSRQAELEILAYDLKRLAFYGDTTKIQPTSLLYDFALALRGRISSRVLELSPAFAIASAEQMAMGAQQTFQQSQGLLPPGPGDGNVADATGVRQPGMGMPTTPTGEPGGGQIPGVAPAPQAVAV